MAQISSETVRADFNDPNTVVYYARAAHFLGLWKSEQLLIERFFPNKKARLLEAGCGAGRVTVGLWDLGFRHITAFDFADELLDQARQLARDRGGKRIRFLHADATKLDQTLVAACHTDDARNVPDSKTQLRRGVPCNVAAFEGVLFMFNGLMQIPGRENRRKALLQLGRLSAPGAPFLFTTHDRNVSAQEKKAWGEEAKRWAEGTQDPRLVEFGDRYFEDYTGRTFMHLPDRAEILEDLAATGWIHEFDALRRELAAESASVREFSDECRFWLARKAGSEQT